LALEAALQEEFEHGYKHRTEFTFPERIFGFLHSFYWWINNQHKRVTNLPNQCHRDGNEKRREVGQVIERLFLCFYQPADPSETFFFIRWVTNAENKILYLSIETNFIQDVRET